MVSVQGFAFEYPGPKCGVSQTGTSPSVGKGKPHEIKDLRGNLEKNGAWRTSGQCRLSASLKLEARCANHDWLWMSIWEYLVAQSLDTSKLKRVKAERRFATVPGRILCSSRPALPGSSPRSNGTSHRDWSAACSRLLGAHVNLCSGPHLWASKETRRQLQGGRLPSQPSRSAARPRSMLWNLFRQCPQWHSIGRAQVQSRFP